VTPDDAARLLAACAAFDNRQPSQIAKRAWAAALKGMSLDQDAFDAVARYYATPPKDAGQRLWIQPHDVVTHRLAIRAERLKNFVYEPVDEFETSAQYLANRKAQIEEVASGRRPAEGTPPMLEGPPHPSVLDALSDAIHGVPGENGVEPDESRRGVLGVECPTCQARIGKHCRTGRLRTHRRAHRERLAAAGRALPVLEEAAEIARRREASRAALAALPPGFVAGPQDGLGPTANHFHQESR
jgi:hypothetical protein